MTTRRRFSAKALLARLLEFDGRCAECKCKTGGANGLDWDHIIPLAIGGDDDLPNLQPLCKACHKAKTRGDHANIAKTKRLSKRSQGIQRQPKTVLPGSKKSKWKRKITGEWERR